MLCATLAGADDFVEIEYWGRQNLDFLRRFLPFQRKRCSDLTFCGVA